MKHEERKIKAIEIMEKMDIYKPYINIRYHRSLNLPKSYFKIP